MLGSSPGMTESKGMSELYIAELKRAGLADRPFHAAWRLSCCSRSTGAVAANDTSRLSGRPNNDVADIDIGGLLDGEGYGAGDVIG